MQGMHGTPAPLRIPVPGTGTPARSTYVGATPRSRAYVAHTPATPPKMQRNPFATAMPSKATLDRLADAQMAGHTHNTPAGARGTAGTCSVCFATITSTGACFC